MLEIGKILRSFWEKNRDAETKTQLFQTEFTQKDDAQTVEEMHIPGVQYVPPVNSRNFVSRISAAFKIAIGIDDNVPKLETLGIGDRIAYASKDGAIVCSIWYKNDGTIAIATDKDLTADVDGDLTATVAGDLSATVTGSTTVDSTGNFEVIAPLIKLTGPVECSSTVDAVGNISTEADISADGDVIADALATLITLLTHFHQGNLGYPTGTPLSSGGGTAPSSPPTTDSSGDLITGTDGTSLDDHTHDYTWTDPAGSGTTDPP